MKKFRIFAVIFGLAVLLITEPRILDSFRRAFGGNEHDKAARCLVVGTYMNSDLGERLHAAASDRLVNLLGNELQECLEARTGGLSASPRVVNACLSYVHRYEEAANIDAFPNGDSSDMSTVRKWAKSDYCKTLLTDYRAPTAPVAAAPAEPAVPPADATPSTPSTEPSPALGWQQIQQQITFNPEGFVRDCMEEFVRVSEEFGGRSREETLQQNPDLESSCRQKLIDLQNCMKLDAAASERCFDAFSQTGE